MDSLTNWHTKGVPKEPTCTHAYTASHLQKQGVYVQRVIAIHKSDILGMVRNWNGIGAEWYGMVPNGTEWYGMVRNGTEWYGMIRNGTEWCGMVRNGTEWYSPVALQRQSENPQKHCFCHPLLFCGGRLPMVRNGTVVGSKIWS